MNVDKINIIQIIYDNAYDMLLDRGYKLDPRSTNLKKMYNDNAVIITGKDVGLFISREKKSFIKYDYKQALRLITDYEKKIMIVPKFVNNQTDGVEQIYKNRLIVNIVKHYKAPKYELIRNDTTTNKQVYPKMSVTDPVAIWYNANVGDVFKITRYTKGKKQDKTNFLELKNNIEEVIYNIVVD